MEKLSWLGLLAQDARMHFQSWGVTAPGLGNWARLILLTPGFQICLSIRLQRCMGGIPYAGKLFRRILWYFTTIYFGCDIDPDARFGPGIYMPHPTGIVIGGEWDLGARITILQGVTLGRNSPPNKRPYIGDDVLIGAGAAVIGELSVGRGAKIGTNAVLLASLPEGSIAVGVPAKIVEQQQLGSRSA